MVDDAFSYAAGRMRGLSPGVLRGPTYAKPFRGVRVGSLPEPWGRMRSAALLVPTGGALTGWSALIARGVPTSWLDGRDRDQRELDVRIEVPGDRQVRRRAGLDVIRRSGAVPSSMIAGLAVVPAPVAWLAEIARRNDQISALVVTDALLRYGLATASELSAHLDASAGQRGVRLARWALDLADPWSETPKETEYRFHWIDTGLGRPVANQVILDERGRFIGRVDLLDDGAGVAGEFNGKWHRQGLQPWFDETRLRGVRGTGLEVAVTGEPDLRDGGAGARLALTQTYALAARRPPEARRWRLGRRPALPWQQRQRRA